MGTELQHAFRTLWRELGGAELEEGAVLIPGRRWRVDFVDRLAMVVFEIEGGVRGRPVNCPSCGMRVFSLKADGSQGGAVMQSGRHATANGVASDIAKYNALQLAGYVVLRLTGDDLKFAPADILEPMIKFVRARRGTDLAVPLYEAPALAPGKRTTLIAAVPTADGSPRRYYDIGDETDEEIAAIIAADLFSDEKGGEANDGELPREPDATAV